MLSGELRETEVFCTACERWIKLSPRTKYELKRWNTHLVRVHGRSIDDQGSERPSERVQEAERRLRLVNDAQARDVNAKHVTCAQCKAGIMLDEKIPYHLDNWLLHKKTCSVAK